MRLHALGARIVALAATVPATAAHGSAAMYDIPRQPMPSALRAFGVQSGRAVVVASDAAAHLISPGVHGLHEEADAIQAVLKGSGLGAAAVRGGYIVRPVGAAPLRIAQVSPPAAVAPPPPPPPAPAPPGPAMEPIVVTAERRSQRLEEVPAAVTVLDARLIARSGVVRFMDFAQLSSGVQMQKNGYTTQPSVRGISSLTTGYGFENNTALYIDGYYQPDSVAINGDLTNIEQVEILKGPQGTLYGRNATAGAILINTREPSDRFGGSARLSYARFDDRLGQLYLTGPLARGVAFSVAGSYRRSDGYVRDLGTDGRGADGFDAVPTRNDSLRAKLLFKPVDGLRITAGYNYGKVLDAIGLAYTIYDRAAPTLPPPPLRATTRDTVTNNGRPNNEATLHEGTLKAELRTGIGTLTTRTSYGARRTRVSYDFDGSKRDIFRGIIPARQKTWQQSADLAVDAIADVDLLVGFHYFDDDIHIDGQQAITGGVLTTTDFVRLRGKAYAGYADGTWRIGRLALTAGVRYTHERKAVDYRQVAARPVQPAAADARFSRATPRATVRYELAPRTDVYASFSTGFRSGVFQNQVLPDPALVRPIAPERITAYEIGFKTAGRGLRFETAAFHYDYTNLHVGVVIQNPITNVGVISTITNAKSAEVYGGEAQLTVTPAAGLDLTGGVTLLHARYTDFRNATATGLNAATGLNVTNQPQDWSGDQMARAPTVSATMQASYAFALRQGKATLSLNGSYSSSYVVNNPSLFGPLAGPGLAGRQRYRQGGYGILNAQAAWTDPSDTLTLTVFVNNLTDTRFKLVTSGGGFGDYRQYNQPVSLGGSVGVRF